MSIASARESAYKEIRLWLNKFTPKKNPWTETLIEGLKKMSDDDFVAYMKKLHSGEEILPIVSPISNDDLRLSTNRNFKIADELGVVLEERIWLVDPETGTRSLSPEKYLVADYMYRRQAQHLLSKIAISRDNRSTDHMTGQVTGSSKKSRLSAHEAHVIRSQRLTESNREFLKFRGGDEEAYRNLTIAAGTGQIPSMNQIDTGETRAKSTVSLSTLLKSALYDNNA